MVIVPFDSGQVRNFSLLARGQALKDSAKERIQVVWEDTFEIFFSHFSHIFMKTYIVGTC